MIFLNVEKKRMEIYYQNASKMDNVDHSRRVNVDNTGFKTFTIMYINNRLSVNVPHGEHLHLTILRVSA